MFPRLESALKLHKDSPWLQTQMSLVGIMRELWFCGEDVMQVETVVTSLKHKLQIIQLRATFCANVASQINV